MKTIISEITSWYFSKKALPYWCVLLLDCSIVLFAGVAGTVFDNGLLYTANNFCPILLGLILSVVLHLPFFRLFHTYSGVVRYSSFKDIRLISLATAGGSLLTMILTLSVKDALEPGIILPCPLVVGQIFLISALLMTALRITVKGLHDLYRSEDTARRVFIYGIKEGGVSLAKSVQSQEPQQYSLAGFVTPDGEMEGKFLMGAKIYANNDKLVSCMQQVRASIMIVSPLQADYFSERQELINDLIANNIKILVMPKAEEWDGKSELHHEQLHEVEIEDLLPRDKIEVDMDAIGRLLTGKRILITGAAGSIGSEMVRQVAIFKPAEMILIDQAETPMHDIRLMMTRQFPGIKSETIVTSISDQEHMEKIFSEHKPEYVFHAAAYKHVPMMEDNPGQAVRNNIYGTRVIADLAVKYHTRKFVMISTDKAVNPTNVMGCSKRICEIYCQALNQAIVDGKVEGVTQFVTTRFGNVLGSNGSVIPIFKAQIAKGGPITVTHPDIIRFFMLIPEACKLVLEAGTMGKGGEIFVFDMGKPVRIVDLAKRMISLSGARNIEIKFSGLRDGEKLYEELLSNKENTKPTVHPKIMVASVREYDYETAKANEEELLRLSSTFDDMAIVRKMKEIVPEYKSQCSKYEELDK